MPVPVSALLLPMRCLLLKKQQPEKWHMIANLQSHVQDRRDTVAWNFVSKNIAPHLKTVLTACILSSECHLCSTKFNLQILADELPDLNDELIQEVCGIIDVNSFEIRHPSSIQTGQRWKNTLRGLFARASMMNHNCIPNVQVSTHNLLL